MESILTSVKKLLGISEEYEHFDIDIIIHINAAFFILNQLGVGPSTCFRIKDKFATWNDFIPADNPNYETVKSYIPLKVRLTFDPPDRSAVIEALKSNIAEFEARLSWTAESYKTDEQEVDSK